MKLKSQAPDAITSAALLERFRTLVKAAGGPAPAARALGLPKSTLDQWHNGKSRIPLDPVVRLAVITGQSLDALLFGTEAPVAAGPVMKANPDELTDGFVIVPRLTLEASAGGGRVAVNEEFFRGDVVAFREDWLRGIGVSATRAELLTAVGDSMEPTIRDGDLLLVDRSVDRVVSNGIYVLVYEGAVLVKRIVLRLDGSLILKSDNDRYGEEAVPKAVATELIIEGRVRWHGRLI